MQLHSYFIKKKLSIVRNIKKKNTWSGDMSGAMQRRVGALLLSLCKTIRKIKIEALR